MTQVEYDALAFEHPELKLPPWSNNEGLNCMHWLKLASAEDVRVARAQELLSRGHLWRQDLHWAWWIGTDQDNHYWKEACSDPN